MDTWVNDELSPEDRVKLDAAIAQSIAESEAGLSIPLERAIAELRAKRAAGVGCKRSEADALPEPRQEKQKATCFKVAFCFFELG